MTAARAALALWLVACAGEPRRAPGTGATTAPADAGSADASDEVPVASFDVLAARAEREAPGMREIARLDRLGARSLDLTADADTCVRVSFAAARPVEVALVDGDGRVHGEPARGTTGTVPPRGPACVARGSALHVRIGDAPAGTLVRAVVRSAP